VTEAEWLAAIDPDPMVKYLSGRVGERKLRLFGCASCRRIWHLIKDPRGHAAVEVVERFADGKASERELEQASAATEAAVRAVVRATDRRDLDREIPEHFALVTARALTYLSAAESQAWGAVDWAMPDLETRRIEKLAQARLLRCIAGNPFRPEPTADPAWLAWSHGTVARLAAAAYDERLLPSGNLDPGRLAVLADALEDAGCGDGGILAHLRSAGPHVRGCWAVDLFIAMKARERRPLRSGCRTDTTV
jgi:hypothetical protein